MSYYLHVLCNRGPKNIAWNYIFYFLKHKKRKKKKKSMVVYRLKVSKNCKDSPFKKKGENQLYFKEKKRGGGRDKINLSVHFIKFSKSKLLRLFPQASVNPKVILGTLKSHLFGSKWTMLRIVELGLDRFIDSCHFSSWGNNSTLVEQMPLRTSWAFYIDPSEHRDPNAS